MTEEKAGASIVGFYLVGGVAAFLALVTIGGLLYLNWGKLGLPTPKEFTKEVQEEHTGVVPGAFVVEGNAANYSSYVGREDVFVLVNFFSRRDELNEDLLLDLRQLSARHGGKVIVLNVDGRLRSQLATKRTAASRRDVRLMHAGQELARFHSERLVWEIEEMIKHDVNGLPHPLLRTAATADPNVEIDPYAESLRKEDASVLPSGVAPVE